MATEDTKIFVGGLSWDTTEDNLKVYFGKWGVVTDAVVMKDMNGKPRGFGFVTFEDADSVQSVLKLDKEKHNLDGKNVEPKLAVSKSSDRKSTSTEGVKKVFIGGIPIEADEDTIRSTFKQYGDVVAVDLKYDKNTSRMRGFGFVEFKSEDDAARLCATKFVPVKGKNVEVKKAEPRFSRLSSQSSSKPYPQGNFQSYRGSSYSANLVQGHYHPSQYPVNYGYSYGQMYNNPSYSTGGYGQSNYGYGMQGQNYTYSSGIENSMSEQHGGDSYSMQRGYPYGGQQQMGGSTYNQNPRAGYSNNSEGYSQSSYSYTGADVNATSGYSGYHGGDKQGSSTFSGSRGGQSSRGPPSQYPASGGFGANH